MKKLSVTFVGCGGIAEHYWQVYRDLDWVELTVCMDVNLERAQHVVCRARRGKQIARVRRSSDGDAHARFVGPLHVDDST